MKDKYPEKCNVTSRDQDVDPEVVAKKEFYLKTIKILYENNGKIIAIPMIMSFLFVFLPVVSDFFMDISVNLNLIEIKNIFSSYYFIFFVCFYIGSFNFLLEKSRKKIVYKCIGFFLIYEKELYPKSKKEKIFFNLIIVSRINLILLFSVLPFGGISLIFNYFSGL